MNEIFNSFLNFSDAVHKADTARRLRKELSDLLSTCGSCEMWMTGRCPRETKYHKVSCNEPICSSFVITPFSAKLIETKKSELNLLTSVKTTT